MNTVGTAQSQIQRRTLVVLAIAQVIGTIGVGVAPSIGVLLAGDVTHNESWAGLARSAATLGTAVVGFPLGLLAARHGRRRALSLGWLIAAVGAAILVYAAHISAVVPLFMGLLLIGAGSAVALQARFAATDLSTAGRRARDLSLIVWCQTVGSSVGPNLGAPGEVVGRWLGINLYAGAFLIAAVFLFLAAGLTFALLRPDPLKVVGKASVNNPSATLRSKIKPESSQETRQVGLTGGSDSAGQSAEIANSAQTAPSRRGALSKILRVNPLARRALATMLIGQVVMVTLMTMAPVHLHHHGASINFIGLSISAHIVAMYFFAPVIGMVVDRAGYVVPTMAGIAFMVSASVCAIVFPKGLPWMVTSLVLLGLGWCLLNIAGSALFSACLSDAEKAAAQGSADALTSLLAAFSAFVAGPIMAATSYPSLAWVCIALSVALVWCLPGMRKMPVVSTQDV